MISKSKTQTCQECGGTMTHGAFDAPYSYGGVTRAVRVTGWHCDACSESILEGAALQKMFMAAAALKAEVEQVLSPAEVARIRERLGLSQRRAGELLGGGPRSFYKYESGKQTPGVPMSHLLRVLNRAPELLETIERSSPPAAAMRGRAKPKDKPGSGTYAIRGRGKRTVSA